MSRTAKFNSKQSLTHLQQLNRDQTQASTWIEQLDARVSNLADQFMPPI